MHKRVSVIIVTYNSEKHIYDCLSSIYRYNDIGDLLEVIIVDNNSCNKDLMFESINRLYPQTKLIDNPKNGGYGQGNNMGVKNSLGDIILIMNPKLFFTDRKSTRLNSSHIPLSRMPSSA